MYNTSTIEYIYYDKLNYPFSFFNYRHKYIFANQINNKNIYTLRALFTHTHPFLHTKYEFCAI